MWRRDELRLLGVQGTSVRMQVKTALRWLIMPAGCGPLCSSCSLGLLTMKVLYCFPSLSECSFHIGS